MTRPSGTPEHPTAPPAAEDFAAWNETMVERYDIDRYYERAHPIVRWIEKRRLQALAGLAGVRPGDRLLEVGCGAGHVLDRFPAADRTGVDLSSGMLGRARRRLQGNARLLQSRAEQLPFSDGAFDVVLCTEVLEHTLDPAEVLRELLRVGRPGARVVVSIPNEANIDRAKRFVRSTPGLRRWLRSLADTGNEWHLHQFDLRLLRSVASSAGARIARLRGLPLEFAPVRYVALLENAQPGEMP